MPVSISGTNGVTFPDSSLQAAAASPYTLKNKIINGDFRIDQRNAGASVTASTTGNEIYTLDRWSYYASQASKYTVQQNAAAVTPPAGFTNYLGITSSSAYSITSSDWFTIKQSIEGFNGSDLGWGTANAKTVTLSFWVRSSLTGTFGGAIRNGTGNRSYPFSYTISAANTWEQKSVTIAGDTTGTWGTDNTTFAQIFFGLGVGSSNSGTAGAWAASGFGSATGATSVVGTNGATFYITGVQLEQNTSATPFERRLFNQELANCQRYYEKSYELLTVPATNAYIGMVHVSAASNGFADMLVMLNFNVQKRTTPTMTFYREDGTSGSWNMERSGSSTTPTVNSGSVGDNGGRIYCATGANWTVASLKGHWTSSAEL
jgi:hypothetical protein